MANWNELIKLYVWRKTPEICDLNFHRFKVDAYGARIEWDDYGKATEFGWEIDHIDPNGGDRLENLQALQHSNNESKQDNAHPARVTQYNLSTGHNELREE